MLKKPNEVAVIEPLQQRSKRPKRIAADTEPLLHAPKKPTDDK